MTTPKPGIQSTEFWATVASYVVGLIALFHFTGQASSVALAVVHVAAVVGPVIATGVYAFARAKVKGAHSFAIATIIKEVTAAIHVTSTADVAAVIQAVEAALKAVDGKPTGLPAVSPPTAKAA
jgi:hypothetical protein